MTFISFPTPKESYPLEFFLAAEEWLAQHGTSGEEYFFMWQVPPTIICGRNQIVENEVDVEFCRSHGINMVRRRSGGGAVYADMNNIMFSYVNLSRETGEKISTTFSHYTSMVADMLKSLGLNASTTTRNDVWIDDRKVSGYAFYNLPQGAIVHGTMLYDFDPVTMGRCLTPSRAKLSSKGVKSVQSHVTTIKEHLPNLSLTRFKDHARKFMGTNGERQLTEQEVEEILEISKEYTKPGWLWRMHSERELPPTKRIDGVGEFVADVVTDSHNKIVKVNLMGDFFLLSDIDSALLDHFIGVERNPQALTHALAEKQIQSGNVIHGMDNDTLVQLLIS